MRPISSLILFYLVSWLKVCSSQLVTPLTLNMPFSATYTISCMNGEPDIYVSRDVSGKFSYPTKDSLTWAAFADGVYSLLISHWDPNSSPGNYDIAVYSDCQHQSQAATFQIQAFATDDPEDQSDFYLHPETTRNQIIHVPDFKTGEEYTKSIYGWNNYRFYHFCLPVCADVVVTIENCVDSTICPKNYSYPELIVSRTTELPREHDYSYKLNWLRSISINHTDPSARDANGFIPGSYYVSVFGWCTPDNNVVNWEADGPCMYAANVLYNVTLQITELPDSACSASHEIYAAPPQASNADSQPLTSGVPTRGYVACGEYYYYTINVPSSCNNLNVYVSTLSGSTPNSVAELAVGKWPNVKPTIDFTIQWSSFEWGTNNLTISAYDPEMVGGYNCGPTGKSLCQIVIGVVGYCVDPGSQVNFLLTATLLPAHQIFETPQINQGIVAQGMRQYEFCVSSIESVRAVLQSWDSACTCPAAYSSLEMVVSKTDPNATINSLAWRLGHWETDKNFIDLLTSDTQTRPGPYYVNVFGWCTPNSECSSPCTCSPCSNVANTKYSLLVAPQAAFTQTDGTVPLTACPAAIEDSVCTSAPSSCDASSSSPPDLSKGGIAGVVIGAVFFMLMLICSFYLFCRSPSLKRSSDPQEMDSMIAGSDESPVFSNVRSSRDSTKPLAVSDQDEEDQVELSIVTPSQSNI